MSTQTRSSGGGRNQKKSNSAGGGGDSASNKKSDVSKTEKEKPQPKPTAEQIRIAEITNINSGSEDPKMREKVATLIEMTQRSEEEVCCALYECDNNLEQAVLFLLETLPVGAFETSSKKKKNRVASAGTDNVGDTEWTDGNANNDKRDKSRNRSGIRGGRGSSDSRGWRGREARENERNVADSGNKTGDSGYRGGRGRGGSRGGFGGRGGRGGRVGPRGIGARDQPRSYSRQPQEQHQEVDTWDNAIAQTAEKQQQQPKEEVWGDWDNEEYVGSLKDTKVFTPSNLQNAPLPGASELAAPPGLEQHIINNDPYLMAAELVQKYMEIQKSNTRAGSGTGSMNPSQFPDIHSTNASSNIILSGLDNQHIKPSSTLSAEQSQYFNSLSSQNTAQQQANNANPTSNTTVQYPSSYGAVFGDQSVTSQPSVRRARAKVPPPSKIPSTAVEMPGDTLNNIGYLDVQFGGLDFGAEESFDSLTEKFNATNIENQQNVQSQDVSNDYQTKSNAQQSALNAGLQSSPIAEGLQSGFTQRSSVNVPQQSSSINSINTPSTNTLDQLSKTDPYIQSNASNTTGYQSSYNSNTASNKTVSYQNTGTGQGGYNTTGYTNAQSSSANTYQPSSNNYSSYNQNSVNSYQQQANASVNNSSNSVSGSNVNSSSTQNIPVGGNSNVVNNSNANSNSGYLSSQYQSNQTTSAFPSQQNVYQNSQSVYGSSGLSNNSGFAGSTSTSSSQYSNFSNTKLKDTSTTASSHFDSASSVTSSSIVSSTVSSVSSSTSTSNSLSSPSLGMTNTKVTNSTAKNSAGMVQPNIQMVSQYIQTGVPYYQQPAAVYSFEDIQMMQQRMPHVTQYYDINYQPQTSLGAAGVRDANLGSVAYSTMTDGRFTRTDNNSSPVSNVSSTMSQQPGSSGPMLNVPYAYFYGGNMMPGGFQYGTTAIYPQQMPAANATSAGQFPKPSYNSGYGSTAGYDALTQGTQDYTKGAYAAAGGSQQNKSQNVTNTPQAGSGSDINSSMYGKGHVALNKSYDKQAFHSGTPPPYNLTGTQATGGASTPFGMYIQQMPATHHNMNMHQPIHQDSNSTGPRQQPGSQSKSGTKQGYSPSYWTGQN